VKRSIGGGCDKEVVRVVEMMPNWKPGMQRGKAVRTQFMLPIKFVMDEKEDSESPAKTGGMATALELKDFSVAPNPTSDVFNLKFRANPGRLNVKVTNLAGQVVYQQVSEAFEGEFVEQIDLSNHAAGPYFLKIVQENQAFTYKIIKQ